MLDNTIEKIASCSLPGMPVKRAYVIRPAEQHPEQLPIIQAEKEVTHWRIPGNSKRSKTDCAYGSSDRHPDTLAYMKDHNVPQLEMAKLLGLSLRTFIHVHMLRWGPNPNKQSSLTVAEKLVRFFGKPIYQLYPPELLRVIRLRKLMTTTTSDFTEESDDADDSHFVDSCDALRDVASDDPTPLQALLAEATHKEQNVLIEKVWDIVDTLSVEQREVFCLLYKAGLSYHEAAAIYGYAKWQDLKKAEAQALDIVRRKLNISPRSSWRRTKSAGGICTI